MTFLTGATLREALQKDEIIARAGGGREKKYAIKVMVVGRQRSKKK
jgi:hypothetical protein